MICEPGDVAVVPFPFSERPGAKRRPALVLSSTRFNRAGHTVLAMITTTGHSSWPGDVPLAIHREAGLPQPCMVRLKLFTLDNRLLLHKAGRLSESDHERVKESLEGVLALGS